MESSKGLRLAQVAVRNFRCLNNVGPLPVQEAVTVVAGQNDGGKTTFLDAIGFLLGQKILDDNDVSHFADNDQSADADNDQSLEVVGTFYALDDVNGDFPITIRAQRGQGTNRVAETVALVHPALRANPEDMTMAALKEAAGNLLMTNPGGTSKAPYIDVLRTWLDEQPESDLESVWVPLARDMEVRLPKLQVFSSTTAVDPVQAIQQLVRTTSQSLIQSEKYRDRLSGIEADLVGDLRERMAFIEERIRNHCADLDGVSIQPTFDFSRAQPSTSVDFVRNNRAVDYKKVGEGRQRKTTLAVYEANSDALKEVDQSITYILVYDEPDSHLDYTSQKRVAGVLKAQASLNHVQVIVATHSKNLIDTVPLEAVLSLRLNDQLQTEAMNLAQPDHESEIEFQSELYVSLGFSNSTFLDEKIFLVVEGATEMLATPILFSLVSDKSLVTSGVQMVSLDGSGATKEFVRRLRTAWNKTVICLIDEDSRSKLHDFLTSAGFIEDEDLFYVGTKEFEDSFPDEIRLKTLERDYSVAEGKKSWNVSIFDGVRNSRKFSRALREHVEKRTCTDRPSKAEMGRSVAITCKAERYIPDDLKKCFKRVAQTVN
jgi:hypothetical protein